MQLEERTQEGKLCTSPDEWATPKRACKDAESPFFVISITPWIYVLSTVLQKTGKQTICNKLCSLLGFWVGYWDINGHSYKHTVGDERMATMGLNVWKQKFKTRLNNPNSFQNCAKLCFVDFGLWFPYLKPYSTPVNCKTAHYKE